MSFTNATRYAAMDVPLPDRDGRAMVVAIVKAAFSVRDDGRVVPADRPRPIRLAEVLHDPERPEASTRLPTDVCVARQGTDVIVIGEAVSPRPVAAMDVAIKVRDRLVPIRVHGPRVFYKRVSAIAIGPAAPALRVPIVYEKAYGGITADGSVEESRNRAGVGVAGRDADLDGTPAPQIEHPARPHTTAGDRHPPIGCGAIRAHWSPRRELFGTFDAAWKATRMPAMPRDFDLRANNQAHPSLVFPRALEAGDAIAIAGMSERGALGFEIPHLRLTIAGISDRSGRVSVRPPIDTLLIEPSSRIFEVVARAAFPRGRGRDVLREIRVDTAA